MINIINDKYFHGIFVFICVIIGIVLYFTYKKTCKTDGNCFGDQICDKNTGKCIPKSDECGDDNCSGDQICDKNTGKCIPKSDECGDDNCSGDQICDKNTGKCYKKQCERDFINCTEKNTTCIKYRCKKCDNIDIIPNDTNIRWINRVFLKDVTLAKKGFTMIYYPEKFYHNCETFQNSKNDLMWCIKKHDDVFDLIAITDNIIHASYFGYKRLNNNNNVFQSMKDDDGNSWILYPEGCEPSIS